jgi:restriction endonuclease S subunit
VNKWLSNNQQLNNSEQVLNIILEPEDKKSTSTDIFENFNSYGAYTIKVGVSTVIVYPNYLKCASSENNANILGKHSDN